jgi:hypothetical protein
VDALPLGAAVAQVVLEDYEFSHGARSVRSARDARSVRDVRDVMAGVVMKLSIDVTRRPVFGRAVSARPPYQKTSAAKHQLIFQRRPLRRASFFWGIFKMT